MRTFTLILLALSIGSISASGQIGKGKIISETSLNFLVENLGKNKIPDIDEATGGTVTSSSTFPGRKKEITFTISENIGYSLSDRFVVGLGFGYSSYKRQKPTFPISIIGPGVSPWEVSTPVFILDEDVTGVINIDYSDIEEQKIISVKPSIYLSYFISLSKRFHLVPRFDFQYEKRTRTHAYVSTSGKILYELDFYEETKYLNYALSTSVFFKISEYFGLQAKVFDARFRDNFFDSKEAGIKDVFDITISPLDWEYGVVFMIGKNKNKN